VNGKTAKQIFVAMLSYDSWIHITTHMALSFAARDAAENGWGMHFTIHSEDFDVAHGRNLLLARFLQSGCSDLLFVDADVSWEMGAVARLMKHKVDVVAGAYPARGDPEFYPCFPIKNAYDRNSGLIEAQAVPAGFLRITRRAAQMLTDAHADEWCTDNRAPGLRIHNLFRFDRRAREYASEDVVFCHLWRSLGEKLWIDPEIPLGHAGFKVFRGCYGDFLRRDFAARRAVAAPAPA
jgi:hypothetical protein